MIKIFRYIISYDVNDMLNMTGHSRMEVYMRKNPVFQILQWITVIVICSDFLYLYYHWQELKPGMVIYTFCLLVLFLLFRFLSYRFEDSILVDIREETIGTAIKKAKNGTWNMSFCISHSDKEKWDNEQKERFCRAVSVHEAGHIVVAKCVNIPVIQFGVNEDGNFQVSTSRFSLCTLQELHCEALVNLAGIAAEKVILSTISSNNICPYMLDETSKSLDTEKAISAVRSYVRTERFPTVLSEEEEFKMVNDYLERFFEESQEMIRQHQEEVEKIANEILEKMP